jgi:hypothetical protein
LADRRFLIRFKPPEMSTQPVIAERAEIHADHLIFLDSKGNVAAFFLMAIVESWTESDL